MDAFLLQFENNYGKFREQGGKLSPKESPEDAYTVQRGEAPKDRGSI